MSAPQGTAQGAAPGITVPPDLLAKYPQLVPLILSSESMNQQERQYWINILPVMTAEQVSNLEGILLNEKKQLEAIDKKYSKEIDQIGQAQMLRQTEDERRKRAEERKAAEAHAESKEDDTAEDILKKIEGV